MNDNFLEEAVRLAKLGELERVLKWWCDETKADQKFGQYYALRIKQIKKGVEK